MGKMKYCFECPFFLIIEKKDNTYSCEKAHKKLTLDTNLEIPEWCPNQTIIV